MRPIYRNVLIGLAVVLVVTIALLSFAASRLDPVARDYAERALEQKMQSDVEIGDLKLSLTTGISAKISKLVLRYQGRTDVPPFIQIEEAQVTTNWLSLLYAPRTINLVVLKGLRIHIPPKPDGGSRFGPRKPKGDRKPPPDFVISHVIADGTVLQIIPKEAGKEPLEWDIRKLALKSAGPNDAMNFDAILRNAKPPGDITSKGKFGPWNADDLGETPVSGDYQFRNADLGVFKGIAGILSSDGSYKGALGRIEVDGKTDTPDFRLGAADNPLPLKTTFHAIVDGTSGNTYLQPVNAMLADTAIYCSGAVEGKPGVKGKTINLDTAVKGGKLRDVLRLAVRGNKPPMTGGIGVKAKLLIPPGDVDVVQKLQLDGTFSMERVRFTSPELQEKIEGLSMRARGKPGQETEDVTSHFDGKFNVKNGTIAMNHLIFAMPGAEVQLAGNYGMRSEKLDFAGQVRLQARLSQMVKGVKGWLLKPVDPFFAKDGAGAVVPIRITGTREKPEFGLSFRRGKKAPQKQEESSDKKR